LDAAFQNGSRDVRWPLGTIYRPRSGEKVVTLLESLTDDRDKDAAIDIY